MPRSRHITGIEAARLANEKRARLSLLPSESGDKQLDEPVSSLADKIAKKAPPLPSAGDAERPMSDARRTVAGSPEGQ